LLDWKNSLKGVLVGGLAGAAVGLAGFFLAEIPGTHAMGPVMFLLVPFVAGLAINLVSRDLETTTAAVLLATIGTMALLIAMHMETPVCALLAFPLLLVGIGLGAAFGNGVRALRAKFKSKAATFTSVVLLSMPLLIFTGHRIELSTLTHPRREVVTSSIQLPADPDHVWSELQSFDSLAGEKPLLMYIGLPVPVRCVLRGTGPGAKRTCYFDHGSIEETVIEWAPPNFMRLSIDRTNMPGRPWLSFEYATYTLQQDGGGTILTRTTTIISNLYPAWYWRPFERWGVSSEHNYIFSDLARRSQR
jgi:Polyketide cyclase / dehydrase and lipid transport